MLEPDGQVLEIHIIPELALDVTDEDAEVGERAWLLPHQAETQGDGLAGEVPEWDSQGQVLPLEVRHALNVEHGGKCSLGRLDLRHATLDEPCPMLELQGILELVVQEKANIGHSVHGLPEVADLLHDAGAEVGSAGLQAGHRLHEVLAGDVLSHRLGLGEEPLLQIDAHGKVGDGLACRLHVSDLPGQERRGVDDACLSRTI